MTRGTSAHIPGYARHVGATITNCPQCKAEGRAAPESRKVTIARAVAAAVAEEREAIALWLANYPLGLDSADFYTELKLIAQRVRSKEHLKWARGDTQPSPAHKCRYTRPVRTAEGDEGVLACECGNLAEQPSCKEKKS